MVIGNVERALLASIMERAGGNQTQAADMLGHEPQHAAHQALEVRNPVAHPRDGPAQSVRRDRVPRRSRRLAAPPDDVRPIARALLSVSDKTGLVEFARGLAALGVTLLSTGGTAKALADAGLPVTEVGDYTGFPEMLDGRVKTLHPKVHGGILARRDVPRTWPRSTAHVIPTIDLVVVNLYPFRADGGEAGLHARRRDREHRHRRPAMVRAAAKNWQHVGVVVDPADYAGAARRTAANGRRCRHATRVSARAEGVRAHGRLRRRDLATG